MYLEYADYQNMGGTLDETTFNDYEYEAETIVNWYTFNRLKDEETYPDELARCMYRLIYLIKLEYDAMLLGKQVSVSTDSEGNTTTTTVEPFISGQSNDGVSVTYNAVDADDIVGKFFATGKDNPFMKTVFRYLQGVRNSKNKKLTYRGLYPDE